MTRDDREPIITTSSQDLETSQTTFDIASRRQNSDDIDVETKSDYSEGTSKWLIPFCVCLLAVFVCGIVVGYVVFMKTGPPPTPNHVTNYNSTLSDLLQTAVNESFLMEELIRYASTIHQPGSETNTKMAEQMAADWKSWGWQNVQLDTYDVPLSRPHPTQLNQVHLLDVNGTLLVAFNTTQLDGSLPVYHGFSRDGSAEAEFVFANYASISDLELLNKSGVDFCNGRVVIARLGSGFRGNKGKHLEKACKKFGAVQGPGGLLLYPDTAQFARDPSRVWPKGWWLPEDASVFGHVLLDSEGVSPNLPDNAGIYATKNITNSMVKFPIQPISYGDARILFNHLGGYSVPSAWNDSMAESIGPSKDYKLQLKSFNQIIEGHVTNVIGVLPGAEEPDRYVLLGNHRDAWAFGASDPVSGTVVFQQVFKLLGYAYTHLGYRPRRTLVAVSWDGEEIGLVGSQQFCQRLWGELGARSVAYLNADCPVKGNWSFNGRADPLFADLMKKSARSVKLSPNNSATLFQDWTSKQPDSTGKEPRVALLGGGSDHITFSYKLGIPSIYPEYRYKEFIPSMPAYHTVYDTIKMMTTYIDPGLEHHALIARFLLDSVLRLSDSIVLPYSLAYLGDLMSTEIEKVSQITTNYTVFKTGIVSLDAIRTAIVDLRESIKEFNNVTSQVNSSTKSSHVRILNDILMQFPRMFLFQEGLPTRPELKNILLSPALQNSYSSSVFTGLRDALSLTSASSTDATILKRQLSILVHCLRQANHLIRGGLVTLTD